MTSPDYKDSNKDEAVEDFKKRIKHYEDFYEAIDDDHDNALSYIKIYNQGSKFLVNKVQGRNLVCFTENL